MSPKLPSKYCGEIIYAGIALQIETLPRLPKIYWGEIIYATPGSGKTFVASKCRNVWDADELIVETIDEKTNFDCSIKLWGNVDKRIIIRAYFRYIKFNKRLTKRIYRLALQKMRDICSNGINVVLIGTKDLMHVANRIFIQQNVDIVRNGFKSHKESNMVDDIPNNGIYVHYIDEYLEKSLQKLSRKKQFSFDKNTPT